MPEKKTELYSFEKVRKALGAHKADLEKALDLGLVTRVDDEKFSLAEAELIQAHWPETLLAVRAQDLLSAFEIGDLLNIEPATVKDFAKKHSELLVARGFGSFKWGDYPLYRRCEVESLQAQLISLDSEKMRRRALRAQHKEERLAKVVAQASVKRLAGQQKIESENNQKTALAAAMVAMLPTRRFEPRITAHLGPTNSGKTYAALERLIAAGDGVYAAPLRMMAQEVHARLAERLGEEAVGLITGEERINEHAPIIACTTEMVPRTTKCLVLDEAHWLVDPDRGSAWTNALIGTECEEMHLVGSFDVLPLLRALAPEATLLTYERFTPLEYIGKRRLREIKPKTVVVAFSRKAVYALSREISKHFPNRVGVLYGAMPLTERRVQISRFLAGEISILVATDVLGHGVNLPAQTVLFAETSKYDGVMRRNLEPWEVAQIAGRAGRYGYHDYGQVGVLETNWSQPIEKIIQAGLSPQIHLAATGQVAATDQVETESQNSLNPVLTGQTVADSAANGEILGFRAITQAIFGPSYDDLANFPLKYWDYAFEVWTTEAQGLHQKYAWLSLASLVGIRARLNAIPKKLLYQMNPQAVWTLIHGPIDLDNERNNSNSEELIIDLAQAVVDPKYSLRRYLQPPGQRWPLEALEQQSNLLTVCRWFANHYPARGQIDLARVVEVEKLNQALLSAKVRTEIAENSYGVCEVCGNPTLPWFNKCNDCFQSRPSWRDDFDLEYS
jgi:hypothetical protein